MRRRWMMFSSLLLFLVGCAGGAIKQTGVYKTIPAEWIANPPVTYVTDDMRCPALVLVIWYPKHVPNPQPVGQGLVIADLSKIFILEYVLNRTSQLYGEFEWVRPIRGKCGDM